MNVFFEGALKSGVSDSLKSLYGMEAGIDSIHFQETKKEFEGDVTLVTFPFIKSSKKSPEETGKEIGKYLEEKTNFIASFNVVKGFLNLVITEEFWKNFFLTVSADPSWLFDPTKNETLSRGKKFLMVEYSSPNTNKPLHLGHVRNNLLGYSVAGILEAAGHRVMKVNLVNDRGVHICKSMLAWKKFGHGETPESSGMKGDHLVGKYYVLYDRKYKEEVEHLVNKGTVREEAEKKAPLQLEIQDMLRKWEAGDKETLDLWNLMNGWVYKGFDVTYKKLGVGFDKMYYESNVYLLGKKIVEEGEEKKVFFRKEDGSVWVDLTDVGLDQKLLLRGDGTSVYITQDLGTAQLRFDEFPGLDQLIYVVGNEQEYHFKVLKEIFKKLKRPWVDGLFHLSYGMVDLPSGKMKSREGTVVDADDLIKEITEEAEMTTKALGKLDDFDSEEAKHLYHVIGMGALKYFILKVDPKKRMLFNPAESIDFNGHTGPFVQYTFARIRSVMRKGENVNFSVSLSLQNIRMTKEEKHLVRLIYNYPSVASEAAAGLSPALIANYVYELAKAFNHFYHDHVIVDEAAMELSVFRLQLSALTAAVISRSMNMLGIEVPEKM
ncbi:MAG: arginine--tRNA ligase [Bacteroidetes bacterium]|nr:arginine--tRNA ligase [Bacteroidota bacterium]